MSYRLVLDENVEHEVLHRLENFGHDVEHVDLVGQLGKGTGDFPIARYSRETDRFVVTYDDDFVLELDESDYRAAIYFDDKTLSVRQVADVIQAMSETYPADQVTGLVHGGTEWL